MRIATKLKSSVVNIYMSSYTLVNEMDVINKIHALNEWISYSGSPNFNHDSCMFTIA